MPPTVTLSASEQVEMILSRAERAVPEEELAERLDRSLRDEIPLRVKLGIDPSSPDLHLGHAVPLRVLRLFQQLGHIAVLIIGDFTGMVGDPSGASKTRPALTREKVRENARTYVRQARRILLADRLEVRRNSEWLGRLGSGGLLDLARRTTVARILERDDFAKRFAGGSPISVVEFLYPLLQAYDSVAVRADVELGGTDQLFNLLVGRDLQRDWGQEPQLCLMFGLLEGLDGVQKMSKSLGNYVGIAEAPEEMFGKLMSVPDSLTGKYLRLATDLGPSEVAEIERTATPGGPAAAAAKRRLAREVVSLYWGTAKAARAERHFDAAHVLHEVPRGVPEAPVPPEATDAGRVFLPRLMTDLGLAPSGAEARRLIEQGGVRLDGVALTELRVDLAVVKGRVLQVGRRRFVKLR
ncbi:MAG: tyrosine--tRNA ligase [Acidobacteria bacterium]|nr:tyrosine--tRNA ligase [Acidobacteriota bacterium]